jgi:hypothetical protein
VFVNSLTAVIQARGHLVADLDPLGITYADLHGTYTDRKGAPPEQVVRHYMLGKAACGDVGHATFQIIMYFFLAGLSIFTLATCLLT